VGLFSRTDPKLVDVYARLDVQDFDAAVELLRLFVDGAAVDRGQLLRALVLVTVDPYLEAGH